MAIADHHLSLDQVQAAMKAMMDQARATSETPVCMAIVDTSGNMGAFAKMDNARVFTRRHAVRKAYTAAILVGVGGIRGHNADEDLAKVGLKALGL